MTKSGRRSGRFLLWPMEGLIWGRMRSTEATEDQSYSAQGGE